MKSQFLVFILGTLSLFAQDRIWVRQIPPPSPELTASFYTEGCVVNVLKGSGMLELHAYGVLQNGSLYSQLFQVLPSGKIWAESRLIRNLQEKSDWMETESSPDMFEQNCLPKTRSRILPAYIRTRIGGLYKTK